MSGPVTAERATGGGAFRVEVKDGLAFVLMDVPGETLNTLSPEGGAELDGILSDLERDERVKAAPGRS